MTVYLIRFVCFLFDQEVRIHTQISLLQSSLDLVSDDVFEVVAVGQHLDDKSVVFRCNESKLLLLHSILVS